MRIGFGALEREALEVGFRFFLAFSEKSLRNGKMFVFLPL